MVHDNFFNLFFEAEPFSAILITHGTHGHKAAPMVVRGGHSQFILDATRAQITHIVAADVA